VDNLHIINTLAYLVKKVALITHIIKVNYFIVYGKISITI